MNEYDALAHVYKSNIIRSTAESRLDFHPPRHSDGQIDRSTAAPHERTGSKVPRKTHRESMLLYRGKARTDSTNCTSGCCSSCTQEAFIYKQYMHVREHTIRHPSVGDY